MFIEDLIQFVTGSGRWLFQHNSILQGHDHVVLDSMSNQITYNNQGLTEKQANLALKILNKNKNIILPMVPSIDSILATPQWRLPFRVLPKNKNIAIIDNSKIGVEFPFEEEIVELFRKRNQEVHELHKGTWDSANKKWVFSLTEKNVEFLGTNLLCKGFSANNEFHEFFRNILDAHKNIEQLIPMLVETPSGFQIKNSHKNIQQPNTKNLVEALFWARDYGITTWDDAIDNRIKNELNSVTTAVLSSSSKNQIWFDSDKVDIDYFSDLIKYGGPALVIIPGGDGLVSIRRWNEFALRIGISPQQLSVMFRLPNEQAEFNQYIKENNLNNPIDENTKIAFVSTKITKPLIKSDVKFNTVINLGYYQYMHFTMGIMVENARNLVYYSIKEPTKNRKWPQLEL